MSLRAARARKVLLPLMTAVLAVGATPGAHAVHPTLSCGDTVTTDVRLTANLKGCGEVGLRVGADHVTIQLQGHTISGTASTHDGSVGVLVDGHVGAAITGGAVRGFDYGVVLADASRSTLRSMAIHGNLGKGVVLLHTTHTGVTHNRINRNGDAAIGVFDGSDHNTVTRNRMRANGPQGVEIIFSSDNLVGRNLLSDTGSGVILESSDRTHITRNRILHSVATACDGCGIGIQVYGNDNLVDANLIDGAPRYGIELDDFMDSGHSPAADNVIRANVVNHAGDGIAVGPEAGGVVLRTFIARNRVHNSAHDGIQLVGPSTGLQTSTLTSNVTVHNGEWGIEAVPGVIDGGGNVAAANSQPAQCLNVACQ